MRYVVAGALLRDRAGGGRELLLAQRSYPPEVAGLWELPGGKCRPGEARTAALERELAEELDVTAVAGVPLTEQVHLRADLVLVAHWAELVAGTPRAVEHQDLIWVDAAELASLADRGALVPADTAWLPELTAALGAG